MLSNGLLHSSVGSTVSISCNLSNVGWLWVTKKILADFICSQVFSARGLIHLYGGFSLSWMIRTSGSFQPVVTKLVFCYNSNYFLVWRYIFRYCISALCCRLERVHVSGPVEEVVVSSVSFHRNWSLSLEPFALQNISKVISFPFQVLSDHVNDSGSILVCIILQTTIGCDWAVEGHKTSWSVVPIIGLSNRAAHWLMLG